MTDALLEHEWDVRSVDFPLTARSVVWEVGGFTGRWAQAIQDRYAPRLYVFEPQSWAFDRLVGRFKDCPNVRLYPFGLGERTGDLLMSEFETDGASFIRPPSRLTGWGRMQEIGQTARQLKVSAIDLMLVNVEGYEYVLIPHMLRVGVLPRWLVVQTHPLGQYNDADLRATLMNRYRLLWDYGQVLSAWELA